MKSIQSLFLLLVFLGIASCGSKKFTIKNIDNSAPKPAIVNNAFVINETSSNPDYGYSKEYPINVGFNSETTSEKNIAFFFNALEGPKSEKITYQKTTECCPFSTKRSVLGAGMLQVYEVSFEGIASKKTIYFNVFERGKIECPVGFSIKKI